MKVLPGTRFGRWTLLERVERYQNYDWKWLCRCNCGNEKVVRYSTLLKGESQSCGCWQKDSLRARLTTHGLTKTRTYAIWAAMKRRCLAKTDHAFAFYGGRGIQLCDRWLCFQNFLTDMGEAPENMELDRIDNNGHYCPENCRWTTHSEQMRNTRRNRWITFQGRTQRIVDWARELDAPVSTIRKRHSDGRSIDGSDTRRNGHLITTQGMTQSIVVWAKTLGCSTDVIRGRLRLGWTPDRAVTTPVKNHE